MTTTQLKVRSLLEELIERETGLNNENDPENFTIARDYALNKIKTHKFGRTNHFDVISRLDGMEEKFRVLATDALADALQSRVATLKELTDIGGANNFTPETLHLLLELSRDPIKYTRLEDLDLLNTDRTPEKELTWEDIIADDPLEGEIWDDVDFAAESSDAWSGDEVAVLPIRERLRRARDEAQTQISKPKKKKRRRDDEESDDDDDMDNGDVESFVVEGDHEGLEEMKDAQYWERRVEATDEEVDVALGGATRLDDVWLVSELQALREVIFMLLGHPCVLLKRGRDGDDCVVWIDPEELENRFALRHTSMKGFESILEWFSAKGTELNRIRAFTQTKEDSPEKQSFIAAIEEKLAELNQELITIEAKYVGQGSSQPVSLIALQSQLDPLIRPFASLCRIITNPPITSYLEQLYLSACALQSVNNIPSYIFIATIFFSCLRTYLRPIRLWMETGSIPLGGTGDFLIQCTKSPEGSAAETPDLGSFWHTQFSLRRTPHGSIAAPSFIHPIASRILATGKSVIFLSHLAPSSPTLSQDDTAYDLTYSSVCTSHLAPFSSLFLAAFNRWISARHHNISSRLRAHLFSSSTNLHRSLDALEFLYFSRNGHLFDQLSSTIFRKLDQKSAAWSDRFLLTENVQTVFQDHPCVDINRLRMSVKSGLFARPGSKDSLGRKSVHPLENVEITYQLPWPILNIVTIDSFAIYRSVFTFLLQLRRARYLLERTQKRAADKQALRIRQKLLWFTGVVVSYLTDLVLRPLSERLRKEMDKAADVDEMVTVHKRFVQDVKEQCLLGSKLQPIHRGIIAVLNLAVKFCRLQEGFHEGDKGGRDSRMRRREGSCSSDDEDMDGGSSRGSQASPSSRGGIDGLGGCRGGGEGGGGYRRGTGRAGGVC
ncbi:Similar to Gamma-tubulin complex component 5; acc. no. Q8BKN5 [Pyronema omphalodes CBS 100304]|uniref:Spindle pole body component n=1 Tax=Pyronema omphalodes (strain CBS 100304) TaxID=1076935 RepID=U4L702_PYROM|nr:Similar to Gamma-tubulin complex component 5; acc. no. Q8BKN5 [Pyronema omphalodes CBS 100304]